MTTVTTETSIGWLHKNCYLMEKHSFTFDRGGCTCIKTDFSVGENE